MKKEENLNIIIAVLIIIVLIGFIWGYNVLGIKTTINKGINQVRGFNANSKIEVECPQNVIPSEIDLAEYEGGLWNSEINSLGLLAYYYWHPYWVDGQEMTLYPPTSEGDIDDYSRKYCKKGSEKGQNINYYYCKGGYFKTTTDISEEGEIGKTITKSYLIELVLEKEEHIKEVKGISIDRYNVISSDCFNLD